MTNQEFFNLLNAELIAGSVPEFNPNDEAQASAYVTYYNTLAGQEIMTLKPITHFEIVLSETPFEEGGSEG